MPRIELDARGLKCRDLFESCQDAGFDNPPWEGADGHYLIVRLSPFRDIVRSTGHLFLYRLLREALGPRAFIDFAFFPSKPDRKELDRQGSPWLFGIRGRRSAEDYSAILVSCSYALELVNLPLLLLKSSIPLCASERQLPTGNGNPWPLILLGGSNALASQGLLFADGDSFVDGIFFGEGEDGGTEMVMSIAETRGKPPRERAIAIEKCCPAFRATFGEAGRRVSVGRLTLPRDDKPLLVDRYPVLNSEEASTARVQLSWGCPSFCSFCFEGYEHKPYRELPKEAILEMARHLAVNTGASTLELYSFNFNAHADALELILELNRIFDRVNMMSQRADLLARTPGMLACEIAGEKRSFTVGVEGISAGMRALYSKGLPTREIDRLLSMLAKEKIRELKLFYILAGIENGDDIEEFSAFCRSLAGLKSAQDPALRVLFSFGYLVRMPFTPLRGLGLALDRLHLESLAKQLKAIVEENGFEFRLAIDWEEYVADQLLVLGGKGLATGLLKAARASICYDMGIEGNLKAHLEAALRESGELLPGPGYTGPLVDPKPEGYTWALNFLDTATSPLFLDAMLKKALERRDGGSCLGELSEASPPQCLGCSACRDEEERVALLTHRVLPATVHLVPHLSLMIGKKRKMRPVYLAVTLPGSLSGWTAPWLSAWLLKTALTHSPELVGRLFRVEEALWSSKDWENRIGAGVTGATVIALYGLDGEDYQGNPLISATSTERVLEALALALGATPLAIATLPESPSPVISASFESGISGEEAILRVRAWIRDLKLNAIERKTQTGRLFEIAAKDQKKRILNRVELFLPQNLPDGGMTGILPSVLITGAHKIDLSPLPGLSRIGIVKMSQ